MKILGKINQSIWELQQQIDEDPGDIALRSDLLRFFHESRLYMEKRNCVPESERSFLLLQERESLCCFLLHGAGGSPEEMRLLGEHFFSQGYTVYSMHLPLYPKEADSGIGEFAKAGLRGRNGSAEQLKDRSASWTVCLAQAEVVLATLMTYSPSVYLVGFSFGGTLAISLMNKFAVKGAILLSPAIFPQRTPRYVWFRIWKKIFPALSRGMAPVRTTMMDMMEMTRSGLGTIDKPVMVLQAADDPVVSPKGFQMLKRQSTDPASRFILFEDGGHVILKNKRASEVFSLCSDFIRSI